MISASRVGHLRFTFTDTDSPFIVVEASRASVVGSADPTNVTYPQGSVEIDASAHEICGYNMERQDFLIGPNAAPSFAGYFCARFSLPLVEWGTGSNKNSQLNAGNTSLTGPQAVAYARFGDNVTSLDVRVAVSFISIQQARSNLNTEIPDGTTLEDTAKQTRAAWAEKLDRIHVTGATEDQKTTFYTAVFHTLQVTTTATVQPCLLT